MAEIRHVTEDHSRAHLGVATALNAALAGMEAAASTHRFSLAAPAGDIIPPPPAVRLVPLPLAWRGWAYGPGLAAALAGADLFHLHGLWMAPQLFAARQGRPFVLSAHGMLHPPQWRGWPKAAKKRLYWRLLAAPVFRRATILHAITEEERDLLARFLPGLPIEIIPNGIDLAAADGEGACLTAGPVEKKVLYLGRLHPGKGADILIEAFLRARLPAGWRLELAGPCPSPRFAARLRRLAADDPRIAVTPPVYGADKWRTLKSAWVVATPSESETIGMVNLEAAAAAVPSLTSLRTGLAGWDEAGGLLTVPEPDAVATALREAAAWSETERAERGHRLRRNMVNKYSNIVVGRRFCDLYNSILK